VDVVALVVEAAVAALGLKQKVLQPEDLVAAAALEPKQKVLHPEDLVAVVALVELVAVALAAEVDLEEARKEVI
jgi:predicted hotdog family 3-hydroxylacyl-ACP dehydratase